MNPSRNDLIDINRVAKMLGISRSKAAELVRDGEIPKIKVGRAARYSPDDVRAYIERQRQRWIDERRSMRLVNRSLG